eukprot:CAMPEP_0115119970 /NCGR_PEP_ID=MMETSP0227-20121206/45405_1 /TAXON_ID=89957 /ORGANISM="Polarella glacialis, Strain CCMP 1383" /LENGTH=199 /DNA_ID=CAMNT_0002521535 /DNA_START=216 /DNA_END=811 /DNA_ORIENTATION=-
MRTTKGDNRGHKILGTRASPSPTEEHCRYPQDSVMDHVMRVAFSVSVTSVIRTFTSCRSWYQQYWTPTVRRVMGSSAQAACHEHLIHLLGAAQAERSLGAHVRLGALLLDEGVQSLQSLAKLPDLGLLSFQVRGRLIVLQLLPAALVPELKEANLLLQSRGPQLERILADLQDLLLAHHLPAHVLELVELVHDLKLILV